MELWDVYDIDRIKTAKKVVRGDKMNAGEYHIVVHVCIFNSEGKMLIQRRCAEKKTYPLFWDVSVGGSAVEGETTREAAQREVFEELGLIIDLTGKRPNLTVNFFPGFDDVYLLSADVEPHRLTLQKEEVDGVKYASKEEIFEMIDKGEFMPCLKSYISYIFELKDLNGIKDAVSGYVK